MSDTALWKDQVNTLQRLINIALAEIERETTSAYGNEPVTRVTPTAAVAAGAAMAAAVVMAHLEGRLFVAAGGER